MKIGVLSDTHDQGELIQKAVKSCNNANVSWVFHCGDWVSPFILHFFQGLKAPLRGIFGNNDGDKFRHLAFKNRIAFLHLNRAIATIGFTVKRGTRNNTSASLYQYNRKFLETLVGGR